MMNQLKSLREQSVYPCAYREHNVMMPLGERVGRFIPVHTGNTADYRHQNVSVAVYPCAYREHVTSSTLKRKRNRFIPVYTGNPNLLRLTSRFFTVYPCVYREPLLSGSVLMTPGGLSLCIQGTPVQRH